MESFDWYFVAACLAAAASGGALFWLPARASLAMAGWLPRRTPFGADVLACAGDGDRLRFRAAGRRLGVTLAAVLAATLCGALAALLLDPAAKTMLPGWAWGVLAAIAMALVVLAAFDIVRLVRLRGRLRFAWAARAAVGNILKRLNFAGNRIFHEVVVEGATIDHVVLGVKGVFAINVVARTLPRKSEGRPSAELKNGKLRLGGNAEALPVGDAARNMTLLSAALSRIVGHRVPVRSVLAVPGWHCVPSGAGNHLVLNESSLAMVTSWNTPDAYLMDEDCLTIQTFLHEASRASRMD